MAPDRDRLRARAALAGLLALLVVALVMPIISSPANLPSSSSGPSDTDMFRAVVDRLRAGESYYPAMGTELRAGNFPTASVFNWRTPALYAGLALGSRWLALVAAVALGVAVLGALMLHLAKHASPEGTILGLLMATAAVVTVVDDQGRWLTEAWSGLLIGLSVAAYIWRLPVAGALAGVMALFVRELAAPYCAVCLVLAIRARRAREVRMWAVGLAVFAIYYSWHVLAVLDEIRPGDLAHPAPWVRFGGLGFWLATLRTNRILFAAPQAGVAVASVLIVAALWARDLPAHLRWSIVAYGVFFAVAGQPFNDYWGFLPAIIHAFALAYGPVGVLTLVRRATAPAPRIQTT